jgi:hypothetical protein
VCNRFNRWAKQDGWLRILERLSVVSPESLHLLDSLIARAHQMSRLREQLFGPEAGTSLAGLSP